MELESGIRGAGAGRLAALPVGSSSSGNGDGDQLTPIHIKPPALKRRMSEYSLLPEDFTQEYDDNDGASSTGASTSVRAGSSAGAGAAAGAGAGAGAGSGAGAGASAHACGDSQASKPPLFITNVDGMLKKHGRLAGWNTRYGAQ
jgi:hypothetical protein